MALDDAFEDSPHQTTNRENTIVSVLIIEVIVDLYNVISVSGVRHSDSTSLYTLLSAHHE